jgi:hypothetical protein
VISLARARIGVRKITVVATAVANAIAPVTTTLAVPPFLALAKKNNPKKVLFI